MGFMSPRRNSAVREPTARIGRLAKLPVFWALDGKRVLVAGGSDAAAWKAELLAACGAEVHVFAPREEIDVTMAALVDTRKGAAGAFVHHDGGWREACFRHFAMAVGDCGDEEAGAFFAAADAAGIPVNVIDKPAYCQFQFGAIVNRSPVVIGISTDGAAPILAQAIRRRVEAVLPRALAGWAALAQSVRAAVNDRFASGAVRRAFWERFTERALAGEEEAPEAGAILGEGWRGAEAAASLSVVPLASADPELLTLKAVRLLQSADLILHDEAVPPAILELARREARRIRVPESPAGSARLLSRSRGRLVRLVLGDDLAERVAAESRNARRLGIAVSVLPCPVALNGARGHHLRPRFGPADAGAAFVS